MNRDQALLLLKQRIKNKNLIKHSLAVEACLRELAKKFDEDEEKWGLAGLLHDLDYEETLNNPQEHAKKAALELSALGLDHEIVHAVLAHNEATGVARESKLDRAIYAADPLTGLIVAAVLVLPSKKIADLTVQSVLNRFKEKSFARGANRETILACQELGLNLEEFIAIGIKAIQKISEELGL
jgi:putative nucleotidyltransferase with HDIG domain